jgi:hypothetical protein
LLPGQPGAPPRPAGPRRNEHGVGVAQRRRQAPWADRTLTEGGNPRAHRIRFRRCFSRAAFQESPRRRPADRFGDCFLGSFPPVARGALADSQFGGIWACAVPELAYRRRAGVFCARYAALEYSLVKPLTTCLPTKPSLSTWTGLPAMACRHAPHEPRCLRGGCHPGKPSARGSQAAHQRQAPGGQPPSARLIPAHHSGVDSAA